VPLIKFERASNGWSLRLTRHVHIAVFSGMRARRFSWEYLSYGSTRYVNVCFADPTAYRWWAHSVYVYFNRA
jgi:hypothetical protein